MAQWARESQNLLEKLVTPGPLVAGHAKLEKDCLQCHVPFARESQTRLCLTCHKEIMADRLTHTRFHGRQTEIAQKECRSCHTDHKGRDADIVGLDRETFDHAVANFALRGRARVGRRAANAIGRRQVSRRRPADCFACHKTADPHKGALKTCDGCHGETAWRTVKPFDHAETKFPLKGAHGAVACATVSCRRALCRCRDDLPRLPSDPGRPSRPVRRQMRVVPHPDQMEARAVRSRQDEVSAARRAREGQMRCLPHRLAAGRKGRDRLRVLPQEG